MMSGAPFSGVIAANHPALAGHFPGNPITPGVVLLNQVALAFQHWQETADQVHQTKQICGFSLVKFVSPLRPGEAFLIHWTAGTDTTARFQVKVGERLVASGECIFQVRA